MKKIQTRLVVGVLALAMLTCAVAAQNSSASRKAAQARVLTNAISETLRSQNKGRYDDNFRRMAAERKALLADLAETNAAAVLQNSLPAEALSRMPAELAGLFEKHGTFGGELVIEAECEEHDSRTHRYIRSGDDSKQLYLDSEPTMELKTGDQVAVTGVAIDDKVVASAEQTTVTSSSTSASTTGEKRVLVILVNFQDKATQPFTVEQARDVTFNQTSNYIRENSYGQTWLTGDVYGWYTIPVNSTGCDLAAISSYGKQAAANSGANVASYSHIVYGFPRNACQFTGNATVGGSPTQSWINEWFELGVVGHEFGHNLGLYHSRSLDCGPAVVGDNCTYTEYGDNFDMMGAGQSAHYNLFQKERLGWVNYGSQPPVQTVSASGTYWIDGYSSPGVGSKGLKILKSVDPTTGKRTWYYLERRAPYGFDAYLSGYSNVMNGVIVHSGSDSNIQNIYLLDMTPETASWYDPALTVGKSFTDVTAGVKITVLSADSSGASVSVEMNAQACVRVNPTVSVTPGQSNWMAAGTSFAYSLTVRNNNSGGCPSETFNLSSTIPSGLMGSFSTPSLYLANGESRSATINVSSGQYMADGVYNFGVTAANTSSLAFASGGSASYVLVSGLAVAASPSSSKYSRSQTASITSTVQAAGSAVGSATVTFSMTKPNGTTVTYSALTGSDGRATFSYKFDRKRDPTGTYTVKAGATAKGYIGQATTSFVVNK